MVIFTPVYSFFGYVSAGRGLINFLFLLTFPIFRISLKNALLCKRGKDDEVYNYTHEGFLCSQMNMELVCSIL